MGKKFKLIAFLLALQMLMLSGPIQAVWAAMVRTEEIIHSDQARLAQERLNHFLAREDIIALLESRGIDPMEVKARVNSLSNEELERIADMLDQLPAGGGGFETFIIVIFLVFLILLFTDIAGYTDVFPFVNKSAAGRASREQVHKSVGQPKARPARTVAGINPEAQFIVYFSPNSNNLTASAYERLDRVALFMSKNPETRINIKGFSDSTGTSSYDKMVSEARANTVKNYLIAKGVAPAKISTAATELQEAPTGSANAQTSPENSRVVIEFR
jgi:outer membrane protein OmpA-like peptidoglycan-associated protein